MKSQSHDLVDFTTKIDFYCSPQRYLFFVELADYSPLTTTEVTRLEQILSEELEKNLNIANSYYKTKRSLDDINPARVVLVKQGTFRTAVEMLVDRGVPKVQIKIPRYARKPELIKLLQKNLIVDSG